MPHKILKVGKELTEYKKANVGTLCPLCGRSMAHVESRNQVVDHNHKTGKIRGILCRNCNGIEGKINNLCTRAGKHISNADFLQRLERYWRLHENDLPGTQYYYPGSKETKSGIKPPVKKRRRRR